MNINNNSASTNKYNIISSLKLDGDSWKEMGNAPVKVGWGGLSHCLYRRPNRSLTVEHQFWRWVELMGVNKVGRRKLQVISQPNTGKQAGGGDFGNP